MTNSIKTLTALACTAAAPLFIQVRAHCEDPAGWRKEGKTGPKSECLAHVKTVWTDMTPASLRRRSPGNP